MPGDDLVAAERLELVGNDAGRAVHVEEQFGVLVEVAPPGGDFVGEVGNAIDDGHEKTLGKGGTGDRSLSSA